MRAITRRYERIRASASSRPFAFSWIHGCLDRGLCARVSVTTADGRSWTPDDAWRHADDGFDRARHESFDAAVVDVMIPGRSWVQRHLARALADRRTGIGCDQLIVLEPSDNADLRMRIWNHDGGEVESCGNASRCVVALTGASSIETGGGVVTGAAHGSGGTHGGLHAIEMNNLLAISGNVRWVARYGSSRSSAPVRLIAQAPAESELAATRAASTVSSISCTTHCASAVDSTWKRPLTRRARPYG